MSARRLIWVLLLPLAACAGHRAGSLPPDLVRVARSAQERGGVKIRTDDAGRVTKMSVYHRDATMVPNFVEGIARDRYPGAELRSYENEFYDGEGVVYEVEVVLDQGKRCELSLTPAGKERYSECEVAVAQMPGAVRKAVEGAIPGGEVEELEEKRTPGRETMYSVEVEHEGKEYYLIVSEGGRIDAFLLRVPTLLEIPVQTAQ